jgi:transposase
MTVMVDVLPDDPGTLKAMVLGARAERLEQIIKELQRHSFGRRAETLPEDQLLLGLEEADQVEAAGEAAAEHEALVRSAKKAASRRANRGSLPPHLPRIEMLVDIESHLCPSCGGALHRRSGRAARYHPRPVPGPCCPPAQICLPEL